MNGSQTVAQLRRNDPNAKVVYIRLSLEHKMSRWRRHWSRMITSTKSSLKCSKQRSSSSSSAGIICCECLPRARNWKRWSIPRLPDGSWRSSSTDPVTEHATILQAVQQNHFVQTVGLTWCNLTSGEVVSSFLDTAASLAELKIDGCSMTTQGAGSIAASLQRNTNLQTLSLADFFEDSHLTLILQGLETNTCLQSLSLSSIRQPISLAIQHLLERTPSIQSLEFKRFPFSLAEKFRPICEGLIRSTTVSKVLFEFCSFTDATSAVSLAQLLETKPNLQFVGIKSCSIHSSSRRRFGAIMCAALLRPNSLLRSLELIEGDRDAFFSGPTFGALLNAVGRSTVERFSIGNIYTEEKFQSLLSNLPTMKIKKLEIHLNGGLGARGDRKQHILQAVKRNFNLRSLKASSAGRAFFTEEDKMVLESYWSRNERLAQWVASPVTVPHLLWPDALGLALEAGEDTLYRSLQAVLGNEAGSALGQRKRKRQVDEDAAS